MHVEIKAETRRYHVGFQQDKSKKFRNGPNRGRPQTVTACKIFLLTKASGPTLVGRGVTTLGSKDKADSLVAFRIALTRALDDAKLGKAANGLFWQEFQLRHRRLPDSAAAVCQHKVVAKGNAHDWCTKYKTHCSFDLPCGGVHGYGGLHSFQLQRRAVKKMIALGNPVSGSSDHFRNFFAYRRHEYSDGGKLYGLGWHRTIDDAGETIRPRSAATKLEQYRRMYGFGRTIMDPMKADYAEVEHRIATATKQQAEDRVGQQIKIINTISHADALKTLHSDATRIKDILTDNKKRRQWLEGVWAIADDNLTARMLVMSLNAGEEFKRLDTELLKRPGLRKSMTNTSSTPPSLSRHSRLGTQ